jgi:hypothetical protein
MTVHIQIRNGTAAEWTAANPVLLLGEMGIENDTTKIKIGTGVTAWTSLPYAASGTAGPTGPEGPPGEDGAPGAAGEPGTVPPEGYPGRLLVVQSGASYPSYPTLYKEFLGSATPPSTGLLAGDLWTQAGGSSAVSATGFTHQDTNPSTTQTTWTMPSTATAGKVAVWIVTMGSSFSSQTVTMTVDGVTINPITTKISQSGFSTHIYAMAGGTGCASKTAVFAWTGGSSCRGNVSGMVISGLSSATPAYSSASAVVTGTSVTAPTITSCVAGTVEVSAACGETGVATGIADIATPSGLTIVQETYYTPTSLYQASALAINTTPLAATGSIGNRVWNYYDPTPAAKAAAQGGGAFTLGFPVSGGSAARFIYDGASWATGPGL